jgi:hypothetical protein
MEKINPKHENVLLPSRRRYLDISGRKQQYDIETDDESIFFTDQTLEALSGRGGKKDSGELFFGSSFFSSSSFYYSKRNFERALIWSLDIPIQQATLRWPDREPDENHTVFWVACVGLSKGSLCKPGRGYGLELHFGV